MHHLFVPGRRFLAVGALSLCLGTCFSAQATAQTKNPLLAGLVVADEYAVIPHHEAPEFELHADVVSGRDRVETWLDDHWSLETLHIKLLDGAGDPVRTEIILNGNHLLLFTRKLRPGAYVVKLRDGKRAAVDVVVVL